MTDQKHTKELFMIEEKIDGLIIQATTERSHYYTKSVLEDAKAAILSLRTQLVSVTKQRDELKKVVEFYAEHCLCANCGNSIGGKAIEALTKTKESAK